MSDLHLVTTDRLRALLDEQVALRLDATCPDARACAARRLLEVLDEMDRRRDRRSGAGRPGLLRTPTGGQPVVPTPFGGSRGPLPGGGLSAP